MSNLKAMKKRNLVTELQKINSKISRPSLLKLSKKELLSMFPETGEKEVVEKETKPKQRLLDFSSSDDEEEPEPKPEPKPVPTPVPTPVPEPKPVKQPKPVKKEPEPDIPEPEPEPIKTKPKPDKSKKVNDIKQEIKQKLQSFKDEVSKAILQYKKDGDSNYLIDLYNELRVEAEQDVSEILDANKSKVSDSLLDYVDGLIDCQKRRVERQLDTSS